MADTTMPDRKTSYRSRTPFSKLLRTALTAFIVLVLLALLGFGILSWRKEVRDMCGSLEILAAFTATSTQAIFDNIGNGMEPLGQLLANMDAPNHPEAARPLLTAFQSLHPQIGAMALIKPNGIMVLNTAARPGEPLPDLRNHPSYYHLFRFAMADPSSYAIGRSEFGIVLREWRFPFRHTVLDGNGNPLFVIQAAIPVGEKATLWAVPSVLPGSRVGLLRDDGYRQARWPVANPRQAYGSPAQGPLISVLRAAPGKISGHFEGPAGEEGGDQLGSFAHLSGASMSAYVSVPKSLIWDRWLEHNYPVFLSFLVYLGVLGGVAYKVTGRERLHSEELLAQARRDTLTGLPNRIAGEEIMGYEIARSGRSDESLALLFLDLDCIKDINDSLGHINGDAILKQVAVRLRHALHAEDILTRLGGDEFLAILPDIDADSASLVAQRLIGTFADPFQLNGQRLHITASIGISLFPIDGKDAGTLLKHADAAMYEAKLQGRGRYAFYAESLGERVRQRLQLQQDLQRSLEREEFVLHYQPLVEMSSGKIAGAEALLRWRDPLRGLRGPAEFISYAEESGLILPIGEWALRAACRQTRLWADRGLAVHMAVNLSTRQFQDPELLPKVKDVLDKMGLDPARLTLEITESAAMLNPEASLPILGALKALGVRIAIDDFGTGYSSLSYLKRIPTDVIKIDRSFVEGLNTDPDDTAIVRTVLTLAEMMEKRCLAEGIETREQFDALLEMGCHYGQGYLISRPLPADEFERLLRKGRLDCGSARRPGEGTPALSV